MLSPAHFDAQRNTLIQLIQIAGHLVASLRDRTSKVGDTDTPLISDRHALETIAANFDVLLDSLREGAFQATLISKFQGGKSTTINAVAGSYLSPTGNSAIKCSACPISVRHTENLNEAGAYVQFRSPQQLSDLCREALGRPVNVDDPDDVGLARKQLTEAAELMSKSRNGPASDPRYDMLKVVSLVLAFADHARIRAVREHSAKRGRVRVSLSEVGSWIRFPDDYERRLQEHLRGKRAFTPEEAMFSFVHQVECRVSSDSLSQLAIKFTDCPGMHVSNYDTRVARDQIRRSDAIWYLLSPRQLEQSDADAIRECLEVGEQNVFITVNIQTRKGLKNFATTRDAILANLSEMGFNLSNESIRPYNALLAWLATSGEALLTHRQDNQAAEWLISEARGLDDHDEQWSGSPEDAWCKLADSVLSNYSISGAGSRFKALPRQLSEEGIRILREQSGLDAILDAIKSHVVAKGGTVILVEHGASAVEKDLRQLLSLLTECTKQGHSELRKDDETWNDADNRLEALVSRARDLAQSIGRDYKAPSGSQRLPAILDEDAVQPIDERLARDLYADCFLASADAIADHAAAKIANSLLEIGWRGLLEQLKRAFLGGSGETALARDIRVRLTNVIEDEIGRAVNLWVGKLSEPDNRYATQLLRDANAFALKVDSEWEVESGENDILAGQPGPVIKPTVDQPSIEAALAGDSLASGGDANVPFIEGVAQELSNLGMDGALGALVQGLIKWAFDDDLGFKNHVRETLISTIGPELRRAEAQTLPLLAARFMRLRRRLIQQWLRPLDESKATFAARRAQHRSMAELTAQQLQELQAASQAVCDEELTPLLNRFAAFASETLAMDRTHD